MCYIKKKKMKEKRQKNEKNQNVLNPNKQKIIKRQNKLLKRNLKYLEIMV